MNTVKSILVNHWKNEGKSEGISTASDDLGFDQFVGAVSEVEMEGLSIKS